MQKVDMRKKSFELIFAKKHNLDSEEIFLYLRFFKLNFLISQSGF